MGGHVIGPNWRSIGGSRSGRLALLDCWPNKVYRRKNGRLALL